MGERKARGVQWWRGRGWYRSPGIDYTEQWRADQEQPWPDGGDITLELGVWDFRQTQNLSTKSHLHYVRGRRGGGLAFEPVCVRVCVCWGRGGRGLKWERKGDSDRLKKKWRKGGGDWPGAVSPKKCFCLNLTVPLLKDFFFYHKSLRINSAPLIGNGDPVGWS